MISKDIYDRIVQLRATKPKSPSVRKEIHVIQETLLHIIPEMQQLKFMNAVIDMYERKIPYDRFIRQCKSCDTTYKVYRHMGNCRYHICRDCFDKNIGWCYVHNKKIIGTICQQCEIEQSHKRYTNENKTSFVECTICGYRSKHLASHYKGTHKLTRDEYVKFEIVSEDYKESMRGENNPAFGHGGRLSPFSKKFKKYKSEEDYLIGFNSVISKATQTKIDNPEINNTRIEFYIAKGMSESDAKGALAERQAAFTLEKCIEKYGEEEGRKVWQDRQDRWQETLKSKSQEEIDFINKKKAQSIDGFIARGFSEEVAKELLKENLEKRNTGYSKESVKFFNTFIPEEIWSKSFHTTNEWFIFDNKHRRYYFYDFMYNNVIVEYHGEVYHPNKKVLSEEQFLSWKHAKSRKTAIEVSEYDDIKKNVAIENGFRFFCVYSNDSDERKEQVKKEILEAIYEK